MFIFGMKMMSEGIQKSAGERLRKTLNFITGNRIVGVLTGFFVTGIIQSSLAVTIMVISFVNAGLLTLIQSIGVIMGANIGTTVTAWVVSIFGFNVNIIDYSLPAIGIGFILSVINWKYKNLGKVLLGLGFLFLGLSFLIDNMMLLNEHINYKNIEIFQDEGFLGILVSASVGMVMTFLIHSSSASTAIILTMSFSGVISYEMACAMVLGANVGTTIDAMIAAIGSKTAAKRAALVHVLFNIIGTLWALPLIRLLIRLVYFITPVSLDGAGMVIHISMLHTVFNTINTLLFLPFVTQFAKLVSFIIPEKKGKGESGNYILPSFPSTINDTPELKIFRVEKEISDMAGIVSSMYDSFSSLLQKLRDIDDKEGAAVKLCDDLKQKEEYADEMREILTAFLIDCTSKQLNPRTEQRVTHLLRVIGSIEEMSDECYSISKLLEKGVRKNRLFKKREMEELVPYINMVREFLTLLQDKLGNKAASYLTAHIAELEADFNKSRKKLQKLSRKRIEAGANVQTELLFIDLVRRIEKLGDYCIAITVGITGI